MIGLIIICGATALSVPSKNNLDTTKAQLGKVQNEINSHKESVAKGSPLIENFDLVKEQKEVQNKLSLAFQIAYGGLHSKSDLTANKKLLENNLGQELTKEVLKDAHQGDRYGILKNNSTKVGFTEVTNKNNALVYVVVNYEMKGISEDTENQTSTYGLVYKLHYDLAKQKVLSYEKMGLVKKKG